MPRGRELPDITRRRSPLHGWGVFALEPINKNRRIITYDGQLIDHKESLNRRWVRDAMVGGNVARFINHACRPNCYSQIVGHEIWIRAGRNIKPGEELTYDYHTDGEQVIECRCRPGCERRL